MTALWIALALLLVALGYWFWRTGAGKEPTGSVTPRTPEPEPSFEHEGILDFASRMGTVVVLDENDWAACAVDGLQEDWKRHVAGTMRGFAGVSGGRHQAVTMTPAGDAVLDFVLYPGEIFVRRLDGKARVWQSRDHESEHDVCLRARGGASGKMAGSLASYGTVFGIARVVAGGKVIDPAAAVDAACARLDGLLKRALADQPAEMLVKEAYEIGCTLIGVPMMWADLGTVTAPITKLVRAQGDEHQWKRGALLASLGLAVLPEDPYLEEHLAMMLLGSGLLADALESLERVLRRFAAIDLDGLVRARAAKAEILCKLGRTSEARVIVAGLVRERPDDSHVVRVQRIVNEATAN